MLEQQTNDRIGVLSTTLKGQSIILRHFITSSNIQFVTCVLVVTLLLAWRRPDVFYNPQLWAEDGSRFFTDAFFHGAKSLALSFAGYYHTMARLVALIGSLLPVRYVPHWYALASWGLLVSLIGYLFSTRFSFDRRVKFLLGLSLVATAVDNEVFFNLANWATLTSFFWLLLSISNEPRSGRQALFDSALLLLAGLNSPFAICLWPLFVGRLWLHRSRPALALLLLSGLVVAIQLWNMPARLQAGGATPSWNLLYLDAIAYRFGFVFLGEQIYQVQLTDALRIYALLLITLFYGSLLRQAIAHQNWPLFATLSGGLLASTLSFYVLRHSPPNDLIYSSGRHFYIPTVTMAWGLLLTDPRVTAWRWIPLTMLFTAFLFLTPGTKNQILPDLDWAGQTARCVGTQVRCRIPINPVWDPPAWYAAMDSHVFTPPVLAHPLPTEFGDSIELLGYDAAHQTDTLHLTLIWRAQQRMSHDYKFFVHLLSANDSSRIVLQEDRMPLAWAYPTSKWVKNEIVSDDIQLSLSTLAPGKYQVALGWYDPTSATLARLPATNRLAQQPWSNNQVLLPLTVVVP